MNAVFLFSKGCLFTFAAKVFRDTNASNSTKIDIEVTAAGSAFRFGAGIRNASKIEVQAKAVFQVDECCRKKIDSGTFRFS